MKSYGVALQEGHDKKFLVERLQEMCGQSEGLPVKKQALGDGGIKVGLPPVS